MKWIIVLLLFVAQLGIASEPSSAAPTKRNLIIFYDPNEKDELNRLIKRLE